MVYTEYSGESLADYINVHPTPFQGICPCVGIIEGITYLENYYGFFEVN